MDKLHLLRDTRLQNKIVSRQIQVPASNFSRLTFEDFVARVEDTINSPSTSDDNQHWKPQSDLCGLKHYGSRFKVFLGAEEGGLEQQTQLECVLHEIARRSPKPALVLSMNDSWDYAQDGTSAKDPHATPHNTWRSPEHASTQPQCRSLKQKSYFNNRFKIFQMRYCGSL